jgi:putative tryptophan/tyrosine transport system substrate-binding protein
MQRREFIAVLCGVLALRAAGAQDRIRRVGILMNFAADDAVAQTRHSKILERLKALGWIEGRNIHVETRWVEGKTDETRRGVAELLALSPDVILGTTTPAVVALKRASKTVPIIFVSVVDPVGSGLAANMSRPAGNATGFVTFEYALAAKWLELLKEIAPQVTRAAVIRDSAVATGVGLFAAIQAVGRLDVELSIIEAADPMEAEQDINAFAKTPNSGMIVTPNQLTGNHPAMIAATAARNKLPTVYPFRYFVDAGGLISYGPTLYDEYVAAAGYVDRILRGEKPGDLPVQAPTRYELVVNLKTAKALGLTVPPSLLARADEVIE